MTIFSNSFSPLSWQGSRAKQFSLPSDAFQQLVGDALTHHFSSQAHVATTKGQDGSIDIWVEPASHLAHGPFEGFAFPFIVECKQHEEGLSTTQQNIEKGWAAVETKLRTQVQAGWPGLFAPWKQAQGYLYCISANLSQQARTALENRIRTFFSSLPPAQRPPIAPEHIRVWDWSDLHRWFNTNMRLCDQWLGIALPQLRDHASQCARLVGNAGLGKQNFWLTCCQNSCLLSRQTKATVPTLNACWRR